MMQSGYHPPALTQYEPKPIAGFGYDEGGLPREDKRGPYARTTLEGFGIVYSAVRALTQQQSSFIDEHLAAIMRSVRIQASAQR